QLDLVESSIPTHDGQAALEVGEVFLLRHEKQIVDHEVGGESGVSSRAIALNCCGQVQTGVLEKPVFEIKPSLIDIGIFVGQKGAEKIRSCARVQILAELERDFDVFLQRRGSMLGHDVLGTIVLRQVFEIGSGQVRVRRNLNAACAKGFYENDLR